jgi:hypothetical protein
MKSIMIRASYNIICVIKSKMVRWVGCVAHMREKRNTDRVLVREPEEKGPHGRPRHRWEDNIKINL